MANTFVAGHADRLPWLTDDVRRRSKTSPSWLVAFVAASAVAIIAAVSFWLGMNGAILPSQTVDQARSEARVELSPAGVPGTEMVSQPQMPEVDATTMPPTVALPAQQDVRLEAPPVRRVAARSASAAAHHSISRRSTGSRKKSAVESTPAAKYANPWKSRGVSGRMVRVGAYSTLEKSKEAWATLAQLSPAIKQLPAVVTDIPSPTGRTLYWLQIGTTSQAHSEVLCQRMRAIKQRCVVVDVAGARKGSENERQPAGI